MVFPEKPGPALNIATLVARSVPSTLVNVVFIIGKGQVYIGDTLAVFSAVLHSDENWEGDKIEGGQDMSVYLFAYSITLPLQYSTHVSRHLVAELAKDESTS